MLSIIVSSIVMFAVGAVWFTFLFGKLWSRLMNFTPEASAKAMEGGMAGKMVAMFILNVLVASVLYYLVPLLLPLSFVDFLSTVLVVWVGFTLPSLVNTYLWEGKSIQLVAINAGGPLASFVAGSAVIYFMQSF
jgi:flagellar biosynthesis protein FlhB